MERSERDLAEQAATDARVIAMFSIGRTSLAPARARAGWITTGQRNRSGSTSPARRSRATPLARSSRGRSTSGPT